MYSSDSSQDDLPMYAMSHRRRKEKRQRQDDFEKDFQKMMGGMAAQEIQPLTQEAQKKKPSFLPKQLTQNAKELEAELVKAREENNIGLVVSLCGTLLERDIPVEKASRVLWERGQGQRKLGKLEDMKQTAQQMIDNTTMSQQDTLTQAHLLMLWAIMDGNQLAHCISSGHALYLGTRLTHYQARKNQEATAQKQKGETFQDSTTDGLYSQVQDTLMLYQIRADALVSAGETQILERNKPWKGLPNDQLVQWLSCGDSHVLAVMMGGQSLGWGSNRAGQLLPGVAVDEVTRPLMLLPDPQIKHCSMAGVLATKDLSYGYSLSNRLYSWGGSRTDTTLMLENDQPYQTMVGNGNCLVLVTTDGAVMLQGHIRDAKGDVRIEHNKIRQMDTKALSKDGVREVAMGNNHVVFISRQGEAYGLGSNHKEQLMLGQQSFSTGVTRLNRVTSTVRHVACHKDSTLWVDSSYELSYCGQVGQVQTSLRQADYQLSNYFEEPQVQHVVSSGAIIYALLRDAQLFQWHSEEYQRFKPSELKVGGLYKHHSVGTRYMAFWQSHLSEPSCHGLYQHLHCHTYDQITLQVRLRDTAHDDYLQNLLVETNLRIDLDLDRKQEDQQEYQYTPSFSKNIQYCDQHGVLTDTVVMRNADTLSLVDIKFILKKEGKYRLRLFLNEHPLPLIEQSQEEKEDVEKEESVWLEVQSGKTQQQLEEEEEERKMQKYLQDMKERERVLQKQMKAEEALRQMQEAEEEKKKKVKSTQDRAKQQLRSFRAKEKETKQIEDRERAFRKEMKVGGGFDLKKYDALKKK